MYKFGEYITDNELKTAEHLNTLSQEEIDKLATTYTEGYRIGFAMTGKDISIKKTAAIVYELGFERIVKKAVSNFKEIGLQSSIYRANMSVFTMLGSARRSGYTGAVPNKQFDYDHKDDDALYLDADVINASYGQALQNIDSSNSNILISSGSIFISLNSLFNSCFVFGFVIFITYFAKTKMLITH